MNSNHYIDGIVASQRLQEDRRSGDIAREARLARGPRALATAGMRVSAARWLSRAVFRAEPCPHGGAGLTA